jgi:signal transduction histidine kinase
VEADEPVSLQFYLDRLHPDDRERVGEAVGRAHDPAGDGTFDIDYRIVKRSGEVRWLSNRGQTFFEGEGAARRPVRSVGAVLDITERRAAEEERAALQVQLAHAQRLETVGRLAGGVAHDFNNTLHVILGFAELLRSKLLPGEGPAAQLAEIQRAARHARDLTRQLLGFSRRQVISPALVDLNQVIADTMGSLARLIGEDVELRVVTDESLFAVNADRAQIDQVLMNLVVNSRDAMPNGGKLLIETANAHFDEAYCRQHVGVQPGPYALIAVSDSGVGMDKETIAHIFEPFFTTKELGKGTGLGLATVYGIVEQNGGFINVYSEPGRGATFKVYFPRAIGPGEATGQPDAAAAAGGSANILVVEDEEAVRRLTVALVESIGYNVFAAARPEEALARCLRGEPPIDLVLTDVVMPGMSGKDLRDRLAQLAPGVKVVFTSGYTANVIAHHGILDPGVHFIAKPFGVTELARKLREVLARP